MAATARLELRIDPEDKLLIEEAAAVEQQTVTSFVVEALRIRARAVLGGGDGRTPRPVGGWDFALPEGWDAPLDDFAPWR